MLRHSIDAMSVSGLGRPARATVGGITAIVVVLAVAVSGWAAPARAAQGDVVVEPGELSITFVARVCRQYTDIMANRARNNIQESLRDLGKDSVYSAGQPISPGIEGPNDPACTPLRNWNFQMGTGITGKTPATNYLSTVTNPYSTSIVTGGPVPELDSAGVDTGRTIDGAVTVVLTPQQAQQAQQANSLWVQGGTKAQTLPPSGEWGFGALRCAVDNLNGDNVEYVSYPQAARHVFCYYYAVSPPPEAGSITVVKNLAPGTVGTTSFPFEGNISYDKPTEGAVGRFTLSPPAGGSAQTTFIRGAVTGGAPPWNFKEDVPGGWEQSAAPTCTTTQGSPWSYSPTTGISVTLRAGDDVVCTFTNQRELTGPSFLFKATLGGVGSFPFTIDVPDPGTDVSTTVNVTEPNTLFPVAATPGDIPGTYTTTETLTRVGYGTWALRNVICDTGTAIVDVPFTSNGDQRTASATIPAGGSYACVFINEFTSDGRIDISKTSLDGTGVFPYTIVPVDGSTTEYRALATTNTPGVPVGALPSDETGPAENLPIGSQWDVQEFLPAPTADGFWRVVSADCGAAGRTDSPPQAVVRVTITAQNPEVLCRFTNQFVTQGSLEVVKRTTASTTLRPDDAVLTWRCDDDSSGRVAVPPGQTSATSGTVPTTGFRECSVAEPSAGTTDSSEAVTTATLTINGTSTPYTLGDTFVVQPEDEVVVTVDNAVRAILPATGGGGTGPALPIGIALVGLGSLLISVRRRPLSSTRR